MEWDRITMAELAEWDPPPEDEPYYINVIKILDEHYPNDWRAWVINKLSYEDLFGPKISSDDECRLRFALPTMDLVCAFCDEPPEYISEKRYKKIKRTLITWPLARALIYSPFATMKKIHPIDAYNKFGDTIAGLKPKLISRTQLNEILKGQTLSTASSSSIHKSIRDDTDTLKNYMKQQSSILENIVKQQNIMMANLTSHQRDQSEYESLSDEDNWMAPSFYPRSEPDKENDVLITRNEDQEPIISNEDLLDFLPETKESEAKVGTADETLVKQGTQCQRLGQESWQNVRYAEVQKRFQATPVFTNLKINSNLATVTPPWQLLAALEKMDLCLGAITHGLLQERKAFQETYNTAPLETKAYISKNFLSEESPFRRTSDALLQYTCGKRAEIIQQRRNAYKTPNKNLNELLQSIPPSGTHLFTEPQLSDLIREHGGVNKFFPGKFRPQRKPPTQGYRPELRDKSTRPSEFYKKPAFKAPERSRQSFPTKRNANPQSSSGKSKRGRKY